MPPNDNTRSAAEVLVDQLIANGIRHVFCVPGESYLAVLDAFHDRDIEVTVCRNEGGAAIMAEAVGKATGRPGICFVTRGPGATNASAGIHIARQDSTPMIMFVGQVARHMREREAFQELDYRAVFGPMAKWATEIDDAAPGARDRLPRLSSCRQWPAGSGRRRAARRHADGTARGRRRAALRGRFRPRPAARRWTGLPRCSPRPNGRSCCSAAADGARPVPPRSRSSRSEPALRSRPRFGVPI